MTSTSSLRAEINRRIAEELPVAVINAGVKYHLRPGLRPNCDCAFCKTKRNSHKYFSMDRRDERVARNMTEFYRHQVRAVKWNILREELI